MCDVCHHQPCLSGCPNEDEPDVIENCSRCGIDIFEEEVYYSDLDGNPLCEECIDNFLRELKDELCQG